MSLCTWSLLAISTTMLIIQVELVELNLHSEYWNWFDLIFIHRFQLHHGNILPLLIVLLNGLFAFVTVFIACELGQRMSDAFEQIDITIGQLHWYLYPFGIQQMLPTIIVNAHQPISLECFGGIACTRDIFKNVGIDLTKKSTVSNMIDDDNFFLAHSPRLFVLHGAPSTWSLKSFISVWERFRNVDVCLTAHCRLSRIYWIKIYCNFSKWI